MATVIEKIEQELVGLMGETGKLTLSRCLRKVERSDGTFDHFTKVALIDELEKTFAIIMPEDKLWRFKLHLMSLKED